MKINDYLIDELKRLSRLNDILEKEISKKTIIGKEPEQIVNNVETMCEIANTVKHS